MPATVSLGRFFGIHVNLSWSWFIIFFLVTVNLAAGVFPEMHPEWNPPLRWIVASLSSLLFFASLLAHELAHSVMARFRGIKVSRITLFILGGISNIEREPNSPRSEFLITAVGPATSLILGALFLLLGGLSLGEIGWFADPTELLEQMDPVSTMLVWLGSVNILVGLFNLIPGFPLDGGRVLRSLIWAWTGSLKRATRYATLVGQGVAWLFILAGIFMSFGISVPVFGAGLGGGIWLILIGWFLNGMAAASYTQVLVEDLLEKIPVSRVMRRSVTLIPAATTVYDFIHAYVLGTEERAFPVGRDDAITGIVYLEEAEKVPREKWDQTPVTEIMTPVAYVEVTVPRATAAEALRKLRNNRKENLLVVEKERIVGMLSLQDIILWLRLNADNADMRNLDLRQAWLERS